MGPGSSNISEFVISIFFNKQSFSAKHQVLGATEKKIKQQQQNMILLLKGIIHRKILNLLGKVQREPRGDSC